MKRPRAQLSSRTCCGERATGRKPSPTHRGALEEPDRVVARVFHPFCGRCVALDRGPLHSESPHLRPRQGPAMAGAFGLVRVCLGTAIPDLMDFSPECSLAQRSATT